MSSFNGTLWITKCLCERQSERAPMLQQLTLVGSFPTTTTTAPHRNLCSYKPIKTSIINTCLSSSHPFICKYKPNNQSYFTSTTLSLSISQSSFTTHCLSSSSSSSNTNTNNNTNSNDDDDDEFGVELERLLVLLPEDMQRKVAEHHEFKDLIEIVMDLGRHPLARFPSGDFLLSNLPITFHHLQHATSQVGDFATDNRAGISQTLHRISAIRNRKGVIVGLTCRAGRAMPGSANLLRDLVSDGSSLLLIGPPGVGKTTIIREIARMLADDYGKRVMIVDTSNEIGGDGDIPHPGIGSARRMQVPNSDMQHKVLIEAVENHMPQVIVIDEIGTKLEAIAASTIAQRGIQLVATAHGVTIENLINNPSLEMLVGGIQSVTLGDEEASRRGVQKTVLERRGPSTFTCGVEIMSKTELRVHHSLEATVDALLSGRSAHFEVRNLNTEGSPSETVKVQENDFSYEESWEQDELISKSSEPLKINGELSNPKLTYPADMKESSPIEDAVPIRLYSYGIMETSVMQTITQLKLNDTIGLTDNISEADAFLALHGKLKKNSKIQAAAKSHDIPIYVTKTSSLLQIRKAIRAFMSEHGHKFKDFQDEDKEKTNSSEKIDALEEARLAIEQIVIPSGKPVELLPRSSAIISLQMDLIQKYQLQSEKIGKEPNIGLRILPLHASNTQGTALEDEITSLHASNTQATALEDEITDELRSIDDLNGSHGIITRLPFLPD